MTETPAYDVFISHAFEDKTSFVNELAVELTKSGLKVWYSGFELKLDDSISGSVNEALKRSAFGVVVISPIYLRKQWAMNELNALFAQETGQYRILPILHNITVGEIRNHFPILADRYTVSSEKGIAFVVNKVLQAMSSLKKSQGKITHIPISSNDNEVDAKVAVAKNSNVNMNSNTIKINSSGKGVLLFIIILITALALYFFFEASGPGKESLFPSNSN
jgi:hypothetical protein